ncbi:MAG: PSD1 and planctomycete cytochrome C domain-containing protein [Planctomycetaceae bacterium]
MAALVALPAPAPARDVPRTGASKGTVAARKAVAFFESRIRPVLVKQCYDCHSVQADAAEGGLRVDSRKAIRAGGQRGPAVVPGNPKASWLLKAVRHSDPKLKMPPKKQRLPDTVIADLTAWIKMGAPDPREEKTGKAKPGNEKPGFFTKPGFWAYRPPKNPVAPPVVNRAWPERTLDNFILAKLETKGLSPSPDAKRQVLLRRLHFDLVGLPPSPAAVDRFRRRIQSKGLPAALAAETDELLASPRFGEKWGRHWLDVARFGESSGGEANISFPYAWRYRDYVIDAVNADMPFNRFLVEQIAGDLLPYKSKAERARLLIATGFLAVGPKNLGQSDPRQFRADVIDEQIDAVSRAVMASSVACARCHDHKFDPFSMQDYYALAGVFASTKTYFGTAVSPANRVAGDPLPLPRNAGQKIFHRSIPAERVARLKAELAAMQKEKKEKQAAVYKAIREGKDPGGIFTIRDALRIFWRSGAIEGQLEKVDESGRAMPLAMGVLDRQKVGDAPLLERGDVSRPAKPVPRRFPEVIRLSGDYRMTGDRSGRLQLARWLTHPGHPLTGRVFVNRVWHHLFGSGLVRTVDNFGSTGERPSHPRLLDHLATRFVNDGWSLKTLIREIVLSRTYRQASTFNRRSFRRDPENRLLWRVAKHRLEAEAIRDAMLEVSGELDANRPEASLVGRVIGDRPISLIGLDKRVPADLDGSVHRSVYLPVIRDRLPDALDLFDFAEPSLVTGRREMTNVPVQALYLMNSPFVQKRAAAFARRLQREAGTDEQRVRRAFLLCFSRSPDAEETKRSLAFLKRRPTGDAAGQSVLASFCQALLCTAEFRNLD